MATEKAAGPQTSGLTPTRQTVVRFAISEKGTQKIDRVDSGLPDDDNLAWCKRDDDYTFKTRYDPTADWASSETLGFSKEEFDYVVIRPAVFDALRHEFGGSQLLASYPWSFYLQSPKSCGIRAAFAIQQFGRYTTGIYVYNNELFAPEKIFANHRMLRVSEDWRYTGSHVCNLPVAFLLAHIQYSNNAVSELLPRLSSLEQNCTRHDAHLYVDFAAVTRDLQGISDELLRIERLTEFEQILIGALQQAAKTPYSRVFLINEAVDTAAKFHEMRRSELARLERRVEAQRSLMFNLSLQRNQHETLRARQINLEIARSSQKVAEASMQDAASMRIIAIVTLVFLPPTATATFFSMGLFNWQGNTGDGDIASGYLWVYFVTTVPLTAIVISIWWFYDRRRLRIQRKSAEEESDADLIALTNIESREP